MRVVLFCLAMFAIVACEYDETVGRTSNVTSFDARPDSTPGSGPDARSDCSDFQMPTDDCTLGRGACVFDQDCTGLNESCNIETKRCFAATDRCVGTPCRVTSDCPSSESCNRIAERCFDPQEDQTCMPCFLMSIDCGQQQCDQALDLCR